MALSSGSGPVISRVDFPAWRFFLPCWPAPLSRTAGCPWSSPRRKRRMCPWTSRKSPPDDLRRPAMKQFPFLHRVLHFLVVLFGNDLTDERTGRKVGRALLFCWRGRIHVVGLEGQDQVIPEF